jgi:hypothetical protein
MAARAPRLADAKWSIGYALGNPKLQNKYHISHPRWQLDLRSLGPTFKTQPKSASYRPMLCVLLFAM